MRCARTEPKRRGIAPQENVQTTAEPVTSAASYSGAMRPEIGSTWRMAPKTTMSRRPHTKFGTAIPSIPSDTAPDSSQLRRRHTEQTPSRMPPAVASPRALTASSSVAGSRSRITRSASCWSQSERPKFPRQRLRKNAPYCAHQDPLRPNSRRMRSMSCTVEPTGAMRMAGSPGKDPQDREHQHAHAPEREDRQEETAQQEAERHDGGSGPELATSMSKMGRTLTQVIGSRKAVAPGGEASIP